MLCLRLLPNLTVTTDNTEIISGSSLNIEEDDNLTEEEKADAFQEYLETGKYTQPMSTYIEKTPSVTEMSYKSTKPLTDKELPESLPVSRI